MKGELANADSHQGPSGAASLDLGDGGAPGDEAPTAPRTATQSDVKGKSREVLWLVVPFVALAVLHTFIALSRDRPLIFADEAGYMGNARYLAGGLPIKMLKSGAYYPGYSLLLIPVYWLGLSPVHTYQAILVVNGLLISVAYVALVGWVRRILGDVSKYAYAIAFTASLYPTFLVQPGFAMSESAVIAMTAALPLACYRFVLHRSMLSGAAFAGLTAFLYAIHPRFAGTVAVAGLLAVVMAVLRVVPLRAVIVTLGVLGLGVMGAKSLTAFMAAVNGGGTSKSAERMATTMTSAQGLWAVLLEVFGQFWYLEVASAGLVVTGLIAIAKLLIKPLDPGPRWASPRWVALTFTLLGAGLAFGVSSAFLSSPRRVDHFIYGRYNEGVLAPVLVTGLWALLRVGKSWRAHVVNAVLVAGSALALAAVLLWARGDAWAGQKNLANIIAIIPLLRLVSGMHLLAISLVAIGAFLVFCVGARFRPWLGLALVAVSFLTMAAESQRSFWQMQKGRAKRQVLFDRVATLPDVGKISYDVAYFDPVTLFFGQYYLPTTEFVFFDSARGEEPQTDYVLGSQKWKKARTLSAQLIGKDKPGFSLWSATLCCKPINAFSSDGDFRLTDGITVSGFYPTENWAIGPVRWTDGVAVVTAPLTKSDYLTRSVYLDLASTGPTGSRIEISANGKDLLKGKIGKGRSRLVVPLAGAPEADSLVLKIESKTFVPSENGDSEDERRLGIAIRSLQIVQDCCMDDRDPFIPSK